MRQNDHLPLRPCWGQGGEEALEHTDALYNIALHLTGDTVSAEGLVQETYERALSAWDHLEPGANVKAWLFGILWNVRVSTRRKASRGEVLPGDGATEDGSHGGAPDVADLAPAEGLPEAPRRVAADEVEIALHALPEDARTVVLLDVEGFTDCEVASVLNCAADAVKSRLHRARATLRRRLEGHGPPATPRR